jgi:transcriptional regulator with XRE-family HTH domain
MNLEGHFRSVLNTPASQLAKDLGRRVRYLRAQAGVTQMELARKASGSMDRAYISRLENGRTLPRYFNLVRLSEALGVSVTELMCDNQNKTYSSNVSDRTHS